MVPASYNANVRTYKPTPSLRPSESPFLEPFYGSLNLRHLLRCGQRCPKSMLGEAGYFRSLAWPIQNETNAYRSDGNLSIVEEPEGRSKSRNYIPRRVFLSTTTDVRFQKMDPSYGGLCNSMTKSEDRPINRTKATFIASVRDGCRFCNAICRAMFGWIYADL